MASEIFRRKLPGLEAFSRHHSQARRRDQALENQRNRRHAAFSLGRPGLDSDLSDLEMEDGESGEPGELDSSKLSKLSLFGTVIEPASVSPRSKVKANKRRKRFGNKLFVSFQPACPPFP